MASEWLFPTNTEQDGSHEKSDRQEELFVFGYACKLFRDDDQARLVDAGKYMIPWMGDDRVKIDRYDGRGHLYDLGPYDADNMKGKVAPVLSEEEKQIEQLCDEERYLELHTDVAEKAMYEEEEWKRYYESLSEGYKAVGFSYDYYHEPQGYSETVMEERPLDESEVFVPPPELQVPAGCNLPPTHKENAIIEKTAKFIAEHGVQMEIRVKAKQSNNPMFQFMHFENDLHPYYKHMIKMIKSKKYVPKMEVKEEKDEHNDSGEHEGEGHSYLHPALLTTNRASPTPEVYKPTPIQMPKVSINETPYGQLLASMSKVNKEVEEKKRLKEELRVKSEPQPEESSYDGSTSSHPPPPGIEPVTLPSQGSDQSGLRVKKEPGITDIRPIPKTASPPPQIVPPPPDAQPVIDRMAMYVAKNGEEFEIVVKRKNDPRFQFLEPWHVHYSYYDFKKHLFIEEMEREKKEKEREERKKEKEKADKLAKGVKFKLKKAKEQDGSSLDKKKVFQFDDSSEDEQNGDGEGRERKPKYDRSRTSTPDTDSHEPRNEELMEKKLAEQRVKDRLAANAREKLSQVDKDKQIKMERKKKAAMFINLLKSKQPGEEETESKTGTESKPASASESGTSTPVRCEETVSSHHKSKHKSRDRSRSRDRRSRSRSRRSRSRDHRSRSRDRRSRSRSKSSSRSKKKRKRSHTPPSAYAVVRRSPQRRPPPPPPPRYMEVRARYSRSPSASQSSRHRSRSRSPSRSKSKKKKKSKSPKTKREDSGHRKSSKKKKKRSRSKSRERMSSRNFRPKSPIPEESSILEDSTSVGPLPDSRVVSSAGVDPSVAMSDELEDGETRDSSPEPGQGEKLMESDNINRPDTPPGISHSRLRSVSPPPRSSSSSSPRSRDRSRSPSNLKLSRSRSPSPGQRSKHSRLSFHESSREATPDMLNGATAGSGPSDTANKNVSSYMLDRVRAIIKASKEAVRSDEEPMDDDT